jgi:hypothetical protein
MVVFTTLGLTDKLLQYRKWLRKWMPIYNHNVTIFKVKALYYTYFIIYLYFWFECIQLFYVFIITNIQFTREVKFENINLRRINTF